MSANIEPSRMKKGIMTLTGTTSNGSTDVLVIKNSGGTTVASFNSSGSLTLVGGSIGKIANITDLYNIQSSDNVVVCSGSTGFTVTLPVAVVGQIFIIKNIGAGNITLQGYGGTDTIDGETSQTIIQWNSITVQCYIANKWIVT